MIDDALYDAFGQRQVSIMYTPLNQYHVVMGVAPQYWQNPSALHDIYVRSPLGRQVPLSAVTRYDRLDAVAVNHQGQFPAVTFSFNMAPDVSLGQALAAIEEAMQKIGLPAEIQREFSGNRARLSIVVGESPPF